MLETLRHAHKKMRSEIGKIIIGQEKVLDQLLMAIFCRSHALLVGVPGLAKTLMVSTLAQALDMSFKRIQFTPDLMPTDITGSEVIQDDPVTRERKFKFLPGRSLRTSFSLTKSTAPRPRRRRRCSNRCRNARHRSAAWTIR
jgi:MoxR-like ATPase